MSLINNQLSTAQEAALLKAESIGPYYCDVTEGDTPITLTIAPQLLVNWTENIASNGCSATSGVFSVTSAGIWRVTVDRVYLNYDTNPPNPVEVTIDIHSNDVSAYTNTLVIGAATARDEPMPLPVSTSFIQNIVIGDEIKIYVSATENGVEPEDTELDFIKVTAYKA
jgi:hypothetical protein